MPAQDRPSHPGRAPRKVFIVVHSQGQRDADLANAAVAHRCGADGIFLINHGCYHATLIQHACAVKEAHPDFFVGVNLLGAAMGEACRLLAPHNGVIEGLWMDDGGVYPGRTRIAESNAAAREASGWQGRYFGGVAFKTQAEIREPEMLAEVAKAAIPFMDVVTTSGPGTDMAADVEKIRTMKAALGQKPLVIASGITPENVRDYLPYADAFLVATGVSRDFYALDETKVRALVEVVHL